MYESNMRSSSRKKCQSFQTKQHIFRAVNDCLSVTQAGLDKSKIDIGRGCSRGPREVGLFQPETALEHSRSTPQLR